MTEELEKSYRKRLLILEPSGNLWGSERALIDFLRAAQSDKQWNIGVCCPPSEGFIKAIENLHVRVYSSYEANLHQKGTYARIRTLLSLAMLIRRFNPHVIYVNEAGATRLALLASTFSGTPVVTHVRLVEDVAPVTALLPQSRLARVACISKYIFGLFEPGNSYEKLVELYDPYQPVREWIDEQWFEPPSPPTIYCVGRIARGKGQDILIQAVAHLKASGTDVRLVFFGSAFEGDVFPTELLELAAARGVDDRVEWRGTIENVVSALVGGSALVCPSHREPLGRVLFEAWDAGLIPLVWSGSGGAAEVVLESGGGLTYPTQDGVSLANTLRTLLDLSPEARAGLVQAGRMWLQSNCDASTHASHMMRIFEGASTLGRGSGT